MAARLFTLAVLLVTCSLTVAEDRDPRVKAELERVRRLVEVERKDNAENREEFLAVTKDAELLGLDRLARLGQLWLKVSGGEQAMLRGSMELAETCIQIVGEREAVEMMYAVLDSYRLSSSRYEKMTTMVLDGMPEP